MAGKPKPKPVYKQEGSGRPSKFTSERCAAIVDDIAHRVPYEMAAEANGISDQTLYTWLNIAKDHLAQGIDSEYTIFLEAIKKAEKNRVREHIKNIAERPNQWQADAWILERRWYKHFGANAQVNELSRRLDQLEGEPTNGESNQERS